MGIKMNERKEVIQYINTIDLHLSRFAIFWVIFMYLIFVCIQTTMQPISFDNYNGIAMIFIALPVLSLQMLIKFIKNKGFEK